MPRPRLGAHLIVFSQQYDLAKDGDTVLDQIVAAGYDALEGGPPADIDRFKDQLQNRGLTCAGLHTSMKGLEDLGSLIAQLDALDCRHLCNSGILSWQERSADDWQKGIDILNSAGKRLKAAGIAFHYHNHAFEFEPLPDGRLPMDLLIDGLDWDSVDLCVDVGWLHIAGLDPASFLKEHNQRIGYLHLKDCLKDAPTPEQRWKELGNGELDWPSVIDVLPQLTKVEWALIEQDRTQIDPGDSIKISRDFLKENFDY